MGTRVGSDVPGARWRLSVALLLPAELAAEVDVLRRALGSATLDRVPPHLTLVPPVNVAAAELPAGLAVLRAAAAEAEPFELLLGRATSFEPVTPTVHLAVGGALDRLGDLRRAVFRAPLERPLQHPFVPHLSLLEWAPTHRLRAARAALTGYSAGWWVERLTALAEVRGPDGERCWRPVADVDLGGVRVVGRGGRPVELASGTLVDPEAAAVLAAGGVAVEPLRPPLVVTARVEERVAGAVWGPGPDQRWAGPDVDADLLSQDWHRRRAERAAEGDHGRGTDV
jgi:2'-5' RNA ligase